MRIGRIRKKRGREREPRIIVTERQKTEIGRIVIEREREITGEGKQIDITRKRETKVDLKVQRILVEVNNSINRYKRETETERKNT